MFNTSKLEQIYSNLGSHDDYLISNIDKKETFLLNLADALKSISIDGNTIEKTCCIYGDKDCSLVKCMDIN